MLAGFVSFFDPPMEGVAEAIRALRRDGVVVKILTGDNELVAQHVCGQVGLDSMRIVAGDEIERMTDSALAAVAEQTTVFARVSPAQKNRIILALKSRKHVVGFLGDGINDAPSLHTADVGVSVATAVDVAKDAADIILLERNLDVLHAGILEGRRAFGNVMKYLLMGTSSNFGNMFSMAGAFLFLPFLPMLPTQILLNNFLYDLAQITIPTDNVDDAFIEKPQRWNIGIIQRFMMVIGPLSSIYDFLDVWRAAVGLPRLRGAVPDGVVRRIARDADARPVRHPDRRHSLAEPAEPSAGGDHGPRGADRRDVALLAARRDAGIRATSGCVLRVPWRGHADVSCPRRGGQTPTDAQTARDGPGITGGEISHGRILGVSGEKRRSWRA